MKTTDLWETPRSLFEELDKQFNFIVDLCANKDNTKCDLFCEDIFKVNNLEDFCVENIYDYNIDDAYEHIHYDNVDALSDRCQEYLIDSIVCEEVAAFMNPPYSNPKPYIKQAMKLAENMTVVCLLKCDPSTSWWSLFWDYKNNKPKTGVEVRFIGKRLKFERNGESTGTANFPSAIVIFHRKQGGKIK